MVLRNSAYPIEKLVAITYHAKTYVKTLTLEALVRTDKSYQMERHVV